MQGAAGPSVAPQGSGRGGLLEGAPTPVREGGAEFKVCASHQWFWLLCGGWTEGNESRGGERKVLTTAVVAYSQELVRESLHGSHPGFQFFRKLLSELRPHVSAVASLCP